LPLRLRLLETCSQAAAKAGSTNPGLASFEEWLMPVPPNGTGRFDTLRRHMRYLRFVTGSSD